MGGFFHLYINIDYGSIGTVPGIYEKAMQAMKVKEKPVIIHFIDSEPNVLNTIPVLYYDIGVNVIEFYLYNYSDPSSALILLIKSDDSVDYLM